MTRVTKFLAGGIAVAALAAAAPAAAQYMPGYGNPYGYGSSPYGGDGQYSGQYGGQYGQYGYGGNRQLVANQCAGAVQARLNGGGYGQDGGYYDGSGYGGGRVLGISHIESGYGGGLTVRGVAASGRAAGYGYAQNSPDLVWMCRTDFRGAIVDIDVNAARPNYGRVDNNYNYTPWSQDYSQYGYYRY
jgi:hypothetical protein